MCQKLKNINRNFLIVVICALFTCIGVGCKDHTSVKVGYVVAGSEDIILIPMQDSTGKWGYVDTAKIWVVKPQYTDAWLFRKGMGIVAVDETHYGVINSNNDWIIKPTYEYVRILIDSMDVFFIVDTGKGSQLINSDGKRVMRINSPSDFSEGLMLVMNDITSLFGFKDKNGEWVIKAQYEFGGNFSDGLASVSDGKSRVFIDHAGKVVLQLPEEIDYAGSFVNGLAPSRKNNKYGYINKSGDTVIDFQYENAEDFSEGLAIVRIGGKIKYIDTQGNVALNMDTCDLALGFNSGYSLVYKDNKAGLIDKQGHFVLPMKYDLICIYDKYDHGYFRVELGEKQFYIDLKGNKF